MKEGFVTLHRGFPDLHVRIDDLLEEHDNVVARQTVAQGFGRGGRERCLDGVRAATWEGGGRRTSVPFL